MTRLTHEFYELPGKLKEDQYVNQHEPNRDLFLEILLMEEVCTS